MRAEAQQVVNAGQAIVTIQGEVGLEFEVGVPADLVGLIGKGLATVIEIGGGDDLRYTGNITEISPQMAKNTTYPVIITLEDEDDRIRAGMDGVAKVQLPIATEDEILIPIECVVAHAGREPFVWVVRGINDLEGTIERLSVAVGPLRPDGMVAVEAELVTGDLVVSRGVHRIESGMVVKVDPDSGRER